MALLLSIYKHGTSNHNLYISIVTDRMQHAYLSSLANKVNILYGHSSEGDMMGEVKIQN